MWGAVLSLLVAAAPTMSVVGPPDAAEAVRARVEREVGAVAWQDANADLALVIEPDGVAWRVQILEGTVVLERRTIDAADRDAAVRVAALLLIDARDRWTPPPVPPTPETPPAWRAALALEGVAWGGPFTPQPGVSVTALRRIGSLAVGARIGWRRWCCGVASAEIEADTQAISATAEASLALARVGEVDIGVAGGIGATYERVEAVAIFLGGRGPPQLTTQWQGSGRATAWAGLELGAIDLRLSGGVWVQAGSLQVSFPDVFEDVAPVSRGVVSPYLSIEAGLSF